MKVVGKYIAVFLCLIAAYVLFGIVSVLLPKKPINENVAVVCRLSSWLFSWLRLVWWSARVSDGKRCNTLPVFLLDRYYFL
jgi:hypothetical protein